MKALLLSVVVLAAGAGPATAAPSSACAASALKATFSVVPGSAGAGNIVYRLHVTNRSGHGCFLTGVPHPTLVGTNGKVLPTKVRADMPGALKPVRVPLAPHRSASATARFSPDVPGPGETSNPCEPKAVRLRFTAPGGGKVVAPVTPPTSVCEHGTLSFRRFSSG